jgi:protein disulfide-isomerase A1
MKFLLVGLLASVFGHDFETEESVIVGSADNFDGILAASNHVLVEFYAPWCGHCKSLAPEYAKAAQQLEKDGSSVLLVKVDATVHGELAKEFGVGGYPTLKWFKNNDRKNPMDYKGGRKEAEIVSWVTKKSGPPAVPVEGTDAATKFKTDNEVAVVGFVSGDKLDAFNAAGDSFDDVPFGVLDADAAAALEVAEGQVALLKQFDDGRVNFDGEGSEALIAFVKAEQLPLVNEFSDKTAPKIFGGDLKQHNLLFAAKSASDYDTIHAAYSESAKSFKGKLLFVLVDCDVEDNKRVMEFFGITEENCPDMRVINMEKNMAKYAPEKADLSSAGITAFVNGVLDGTIKRHLKSEEVPDNSDNAVKVVVGKNFDELVMDPTKNVFVEFYAPWCGHCKSLAPIWDELGEKYKDHPNIVIAKSDATANEFETVEVQGFPTLKFFPAGGEMQDYNGGRTLDDFVKFLEPDAAAAEDSEEASEDDGHDEL